METLFHIILGTVGFFVGMMAYDAFKEWRKSKKKMIISETLEERLIRQIEEDGNRVDHVERIFYMEQGTVPSASMRVLRMKGWKGQFEIR